MYGTVMEMFSNNNIIITVCVAVVCLLLFISNKKTSVVLFWISVAVLDIFAVINNLIILNNCNNYLVSQSSTFEYAKTMIGTENVFVWNLYKLFLVMFIVNLIISCVFDKSLIAVLLIIGLYVSACFVISIVIGVFNTGKNVSILNYTFAVGCNCMLLSFNSLLFEKIKIQ